jgi:hypothetical protein
VGSHKEGAKLVEAVDPSAMSIPMKIKKILMENGKEEFKGEFEKLTSLFHMLGLDRSIDVYLQFKKEKDQGPFKDEVAVR